MEKNFVLLDWHKIDLFIERCLHGSALLDQGARGHPPLGLENVGSPIRSVQSQHETAGQPECEQFPAVGILDLETRDLLCEMEHAVTEVELEHDIRTLPVFIAPSARESGVEPVVQDNAQRFDIFFPRAHRNDPCCAGTSEARACSGDEGDAVSRPGGHSSGPNHEAQDDSDEASVIERGPAVPKLHFSEWTAQKRSLR